MAQAKAGSDRFAVARESVKSLYADSGGDVTRCEICDGLLDDSEKWKRGMDGAGAHHSCLRAYGVRL